MSKAYKFTSTMIVAIAGLLSGAEANATGSGVSVAIPLEMHIPDVRLETTDAGPKQ